MISLYDALFIGAAAVILLYFYLSQQLKYWKKRGIASDEKASVLFGSMTDALLGKKQSGEIFSELYEKYPNEKVVGWYKFRTPGIFVKDPALVRKILGTDFYSFRNNDVHLDPDADPIMSRNIFVLKDELWKKSRALITPAFTAGKIKAIFPGMTEVAKEFVQYLKKHPEELHVKNEMSRYTSEIVARCAFGIDGNNFKHPKPEMHEMGKAIFNQSFIDNFKFLVFLMMPNIAKLFKIKMVPNKVINFFDSVLRDVIVYRQDHNIERNDLVQYLIEVKRKSEEVAKGTIQSDTITKVYTDDDVLSGCIMFFLEGYETSAIVLNNALYLLAKNKDAQDTLRNEIDETLKEGDLTFEKLNAMNYLHCVYAEAERFIPVTYVMQKVCTEKYEMDIGKEEKLVIEKGTPVALPYYNLHTDPAYWEDADKFKPERFFEKGEAEAKSKGVFMPFSEGPRACPGSRIATTIVKLALVYILSEFEVLPTSRTPEKINPDPHYFMVVHKGGIHLRFAERAR